MRVFGAVLLVHAPRVGKNGSPESPEPPPTWGAKERPFGGHLDAYDMNFWKPGPHEWASQHSILGHLQFYKQKS